MGLRQSFQENIAGLISRVTSEIRSTGKPARRACSQIGIVEAEQSLYRRLAWRPGTFAFREQPMARERGAIERPTRALLREAQRQAQEWERIGSELPAPNARVALKVARSSLPSVLHP